MANHAWVILVTKATDMYKSSNVSQEAYVKVEDAVKFIESRRNVENPRKSYWINPFTYYVEGNSKEEFTKYEVKEVSIV